MALQVKRAKRTDSRLRIGFVGPSGSGKTFTALKLARCLVGDAGRILVVDTERGSASLYADIPECAGAFEVVELESFAPERFIECIEFADAQQYDVLIIDSLSHAWMGKDGALEMVDAAAARSRSGNNFAAWREVTPVHNAMVDAMLRAKCHIFVTMRAKTEWVLEKDEKGKSVPRKIGMQPVQRDGMEYEFTIVGDLDDSNTWVITKDRTNRLAGKAWKRPGKEVAKLLLDWLSGAQESTAEETVGEIPQRAATSPPSAPPPAATSRGSNNRWNNSRAKKVDAAPPATDPVLRGLAGEIHKMSLSMGFIDSDLTDLMTSTYNTKSVKLLSTERVTAIHKDFTRKVALFPRLRNMVLQLHFGEAFNPTESEKDMAALVHRTHEVLGAMAKNEFASKPLRAPVRVWGEWAAALEQKVKERV